MKPVPLLRDALRKRVVAVRDARQGIEHPFVSVVVRWPALDKGVPGVEVDNRTVSMEYRA